MKVRLWGMAAVDSLCRSLSAFFYSCSVCWELVGGFERWPGKAESLQICSLSSLTLFSLDRPVSLKKESSLGFNPVCNHVKPLLLLRNPVKIQWRRIKYQLLHATSCKLRFENMPRSRIRQVLTSLQITFSSILKIHDDQSQRKIMIIIKKMYKNK